MYILVSRYLFIFRTESDLQVLFMPQDCYWNFVLICNLKIWAAWLKFKNVTQWLGIYLGVLTKRYLEDQSRYQYLERLEWLTYSTKPGGVKVGPNPCCINVWLISILIINFIISRWTLSLYSSLWLVVLSNFYSISFCNGLIKNIEYLDVYHYCLK